MFVLCVESERLSVSASVLSRCRVVSVLSRCRVVLVLSRCRVVSVLSRCMVVAILSLAAGFSIKVTTDWFVLSLVLLGSMLLVPESKVSGVA